MYIAFENSLNATFNAENTLESDVFSYMAGGAMDSTLAGGFGYSAFNETGADYRAIFLNKSGNLSGAITSLNEDFAEFALMSIQMSVMNDDIDTTIEIMQDIEGVIKDVILPLKRQFTNKGQGYNAIFGEDRATLQANGYTNSLEAFVKEKQFDGIIENKLEYVGNTIMPGIGGTVLGTIYDGLTTGKLNLSANAVENLSDTLLSKATNVAVKKTMSAIGTSIAPIGGMFVAEIVKMAVTEAFEVMTKLDRHYGFGGELMGFAEVDGKRMALYQQPKTIGEFLKDLVGSVNSLFGDEVESKLEMLTDWDGNMAGFGVDGRVSATYGTDGTITSTMTGNTFKGSLVDMRAYNLITTGRSDGDWLRNGKSSLYGGIIKNKSVEDIANNYGYNTTINSPFTNAINDNLSSNWASSSGNSRRSRSRDRWHTNGSGGFYRENDKTKKSEYKSGLEMTIDKSFKDKFGSSFGSSWASSSGSSRDKDSSKSSNRRSGMSDGKPGGRSRASRERSRNRERGGSSWG
ncbi:hypothetical protein CPIN18021_0282 [Campylobacter pinnipediorum subsp. caledonicus]|uniref:Uncharacterized protein n=1 Tax=Campylobacter pinnipediorum subsp. caledonicus TaxID=1874362 RepID=A0A1S6U615_9BACT|nr:hypothetical protein [Campylobacter pinnipediorum]AQW87129.1 hypothetical protein CPIN18021_0282 [Campylobacter pinnipediorum subsp. caledonicus]